MLEKQSPPVEAKKREVVVKSNFNANNAVKLAAAVAIFSAALVGLHYDVEYAGWGIFLAVILVWNIA